VRSVRVSGWYVEWIDGEGQAIRGDHDSVNYGANPKTVRCLECDRRYPHPGTSAENFGYAPKIV
jgi:hypothetical protein